jgi:uncharacterized repeat protein (TIGR03803 family)
MKIPKARVAFAITLFVAAVSVAHGQNVSPLFAFPGGPDGVLPGSLAPQSESGVYGVAEGGNGCAYGGCGVIYKLTADQGEVVVHEFTGGWDGSDPRALLADGNGGVYGTTFTGGAYGSGVIYKVDSSGRFQVLYSFSGPDGAMPHSLVRDPGGNLFGTTYVGGAYNGGTVFELDQSGKESVIYSFSGGADGYLPAGGVLDSAGNFYGLTFAGGIGCLANPGCGTVFEVNTTTGIESTLYSFTGTNGDGATPDQVLRDSNGNLYGATGGGGNSKCEGGCGTLFRLTQGSDGSWNEIILHSFTSGADGAYPTGLVAAGDALYGTTGGALYACSGSSCGTIFKLGSTGKFTTIYTFTGGASGEDPYLHFEDATGALIGTTYSGGRPNCNQGYGCGILFRLTR